MSGFFHKVQKKYEVKATSQEDFEKYVWSFYGPDKLYGHFFKPSLKKEELKTAVEIFLKKEKTPALDSYDRELVRDIMLKLRGDLVEHEEIAKFFK